MFKSKEMKETILAYCRVFDSPDGKKVLKDLIKSCHIMSSTYSNDPYETHFNEGARSVVVRILKTINTDIDQLNNILEKLEQEEREQEEQYV